MFVVGVGSTNVLLFSTWLSNVSFFGEEAMPQLFGGFGRFLDTLASFTAA